MDHLLAHYVCLLLLKLGHHCRVGIGLLELLLLVLQELLLLLRSHVHAGLSADHVLTSHALAWHAHPRMLASHSSAGAWLHASHSTRLHAHHSARLADVSRARHTSMHLHLLAHVLVRSRRHSRVAVLQAWMHIVSRRVCRHHFAVAWNMYGCVLMLGRGYARAVSLDRSISSAPATDLLVIARM